MSRLARWLCFWAVAVVLGEENVDGGDILDAMLGAPPPQPQIPTIAPVIASTPAPIISPNKPGCAADITTALYDITAFSRMLTYSTADCAQPGQVSTGCADDILSTARYLFKTSSILSDAVFTCGNVKAGCSQTISNAVAELIHLADYVVDMEIQCDREKLACTSQVFSFIASGLHAAKNIDVAIQQCPLPGDDGGDDGDDGDDGGDDGGDHGGDDGGGSGDGGDEDSGTAAPKATTSPKPPPDLTPEQVAQFYPNGVNGAPPVLGASPTRLLLGPSLRGKGEPPRPRKAESPSVLPISAHGLE